MIFLKLIFAGFAGFIMAIPLIVLPSSFLIFGTAISGVFQGEEVQENLILALRQLVGIGVTCLLVYGAYLAQGPWVATSFAAGLLWPVWALPIKALTSR